MSLYGNDLVIYYHIWYIQRLSVHRLIMHEVKMSFALHRITVVASKNTISTFSAKVSKPLTITLNPPWDYLLLRGRILCY